MTTVLLVRHGRTKANADGILAGHLPGVRLDAQGRRQAAELAERLADVRIPRIISSPLERTVATADAIAAFQRRSVIRDVDDRFVECKYGDWTGRKLGDLAKEPMWSVVQAHPSAAVFPGIEGESMRDMQHRAVEGIREWNETVGSDGLYVVVSHGDVIKAILADALGMHLDAFQRIRVDPASLSFVQYTSQRPIV
ncbi:MAG: MSMEG_4193 family putative phosphomutase, partial [Candidatus Nanopelagicales bacterium]